MSLELPLSILSCHNVINNPQIDCFIHVKGSPCPFVLLYLSEKDKCVNKLDPVLPGDRHTAPSRFSMIGARNSCCGRELELRPSCERPWRSYSLLGWNKGVSWKARKSSMLVAFWALLLLLCGVWAGEPARGSMEKKLWRRKEGAEGCKGARSAIFTQNTIVFCNPVRGTRPLFLKRTPVSLRRGVVSAVHLIEQTPNERSKLTTRGRCTNWEVLGQAWVCLRCEMLLCSWGSLAQCVPVEGTDSVWQRINV